jgi:hypothetical protein
MVQFISERIINKPVYIENVAYPKHGIRDIEVDAYNSAV